MDATLLQMLAERHAAKLLPPVLLAFDREMADALLRRDAFHGRVSVQSTRPSESMLHMSKGVSRVVFETNAFTPDALISWSTRPVAASGEGTPLVDRFHTWLGRAAERRKWSDLNLAYPPDRD